MLYDTTFLSFPGCCMMLYSFGHLMQLCCTRECAAEAIVPPHSFVDQASKNFLSQFRQLCSCNLRLWLYFCARLPVLQSFQMDSGEESERKVSSCDGEREFSGELPKKIESLPFLKIRANSFEEMLYEMLLC